MLAKHSRLTSNSSGSFVQFVVQNFVAKSFTYFFTQKVTHFIPEGKINKYMISSIRGKAMANYPQELAQDAVCQIHTGHMTGLWFLPSLAFKAEYE